MQIFDRSCRENDEWVIFGREKALGGFLAVEGSELSVL